MTRQIVDSTFGNLSTIFPLESKFNISKQIKSYNMTKHSNKLYLWANDEYSFRPLVTKKYIIKSIYYIQACLPNYSRYFSI